MVNVLAMSLTYQPAAAWRCLITVDLYPCMLSWGPYRVHTRLVVSGFQDVITVFVIWCHWKINAVKKKNNKFLINWMIHTLRSWNVFCDYGLWVWIVAQRPASRCHSWAILKRLLSSRAYSFCVFWCGNLYLPLTYNGKSGNWHLLLPHCRYFDKGFTEVFLE